MSLQVFQGIYIEIAHTSLDTCIRWRLDDHNFSYGNKLERQRGYLQFKKDTYEQFKTTYFKQRNEINQKVLIILKKKNKNKKHSLSNSCWGFRQPYISIHKQSNIQNIPYSTLQKKIKDKLTPRITLSDVDNLII